MLISGCATAQEKRATGTAFLVAGAALTASAVTTGIYIEVKTDSNLSGFGEGFAVTLVPAGLFMLIGAVMLGTSRDQPVAVTPPARVSRGRAVARLAASSRAIGISVERTGGSSRVTHVKAGSPAHQAGLRTGDIIHGVNAAAATSDELSKAIETYRAGLPVHFVVGREGRELWEVVIQDHEAGRLVRPPPPPPASAPTRTSTSAPPREVFRPE